MGRQSSGESLREPLEGGGIRAKPEAQQGGVMGEAAHENALGRQGFVDVGGQAVTDEPEQAGAADDRQAALFQHGIEPERLAGELDAHGVGPARIGQGRPSQRERRAGHGPGSERAVEARGDGGRRQRETEPHGGQPEEFAEGAQDHHRPLDGERRRAGMGHDVDEGFIDDQPAAALGASRGQPGKMRDIDDMAVGIVGIDENEMHGAGRHILDAPDVSEGASGPAPSDGMFAVGRPQQGRRAGRREPGQPLDQGLGAGGGDDRDLVGHLIGAARRLDQAQPVAFLWELAPKGLVERFGHRPGMGIDAGRKIEPIGRLAAMARAHRAKIAAVIHACLTYVSASRCKLGRGLFKCACEIVWAAAPKLFQAVALALGLALLATLPAQAAPSRVASINLCTDQLLLAIAAPEQIAGLSPYSRDTVRSWEADQARRFPLLSGTAEDLLVLKPDLVLSGRYTKRATRAMLKAQGINLVEFDVVRSLAEARSQIGQVGKLLGQEARAAEIVAALDTAVARARAAVTRSGASVLVVQRRGWVSGADSLMTSLLDAVGLSNAAAKLGIKSGRVLSLEAIIAARPDFLLLTQANPVPEDQGRALLLHPAIQDLYPPQRRLVLPEKLTICGGPALVDALDRLTAEVQRLAIKAR